MSHIRNSNLNVTFNQIPLAYRQIELLGEVWTLSNNRQAIFHS